MSINGTKILALNSTADGYVPIKVDSSGRLEVNNVENEATLTAIVGYVDGIESKLDILNTFYHSQFHNLHKNEAYYYLYL